jgi:hypothetical protein
MTDGRKGNVVFTHDKERVQGLVEKLKRRGQFEDLGADGKIILERILKK